MVANAVNINARPALKIKATRASGAKPTSVHAQRSKKVALPTTIAIGKSVWAIKIYKLHSIFTSEMELAKRFPPHEITSVRIIEKPNWSVFYRLRDHRYRSSRTRGNPFYGSAGISFESISFVRFHFHFLPRLFNLLTFLLRFFILASWPLPSPSRLERYDLYHFCWSSAPNFECLLSIWRWRKLSWFKVKSKRRISDRKLFTYSVVILSNVCFPSQH
jgi:hypothetical protein